MIFRSLKPDVAIPDQPLTDFVLEEAAAHREKPALIDGPSGRAYTYGQLTGAIQKFAAALAARGLQRGDVFAIMLPNVPEFAIAFYGVAAAGGTVTTVNPLYTAEELRHQLEDAGARFLLTIPSFLDKAQQATQEVSVEEIFVLGDADGATPFVALLQGEATAPTVAIDPVEDVVVLPYSSGTTGFPKGVMLTHRNLVANLAQMDGYTDGEARLQKDDVVLGLLPFFHIYGMVCILGGALSQGATIVTMPRFDLQQFLEIVQKYKISYMNLVPPIILALAKHPLVDQYDLGHVRLVFSGAAPLGSDVEAAARKRVGCLLTQGYGLTEASPVTHVNPLESELERPGTVGLPLPNTEVKIVDVATGAELGPNEEGEILVRGPQVMKGYLNNPSATINTLDEAGWLHTGDVGYADEDGYFWIVDRIKELIKYKGFQVAPAELEALLLSHPAIGDAAVIGRPHEEAGEVPKAFVVKRAELTADDVFNFVAEHVAPYKKVRDVEFVDEIPKSAAGKILRRVLVERERARMAV